MKNPILTGLLFAGASLFAPLFGATTAFSPSTLTQGGDPPGPTIDGAGKITLTTASNGQNNQIAFDRTDAGSFAASNFAFTFRITAGSTPTADGFSVGYYSTAAGGTTGAVPVFTGEEPNAAGLLGFAFDTWNNDTDPGGDGTDLSQIALHYNGAVVTAMDDTRLAIGAGGIGLAIDDGAIHSVTGTVNFGGGTVTMNVDGQTVFNNVAVPGLSPYESRIVMAGRTGGENQLVEIDGLNVTFVPEPMSAMLAGLGGLALVLRRRR